jgi:hypothetical protein
MYKNFIPRKQNWNNGLPGGLQNIKEISKKFKNKEQTS